MIPDYRLSCFEFQDFCAADIAEEAISSKSTKYSVSITVADRTMEVAAGLINYYQSVQELLAAYFDSADDDLSYNVFGEFNTFFSDGITSAYASAEEAPWNVVPVIYCIYRDLIYDLYDGDMDKITDAAQKIMDGIDPYVGNFFILETFKTAFDKFYTNVLAPDGYIGGLIAGYEADDTSTYDTIELTYEGEVAWDSGSSASYPDDIYDFVEPAPEPEEDEEEEDEGWTLGYTGDGENKISISYDWSDWDDWTYTAWNDMQHTSAGFDVDQHFSDEVLDELEQEFAHHLALAEPIIEDAARENVQGTAYSESTAVYTGTDGYEYKYKVTVEVTDANGDGKITIKERYRLTTYGEDGPTITGEKESINILI